MQYLELIKTAKNILGEFQLAKSGLTAGSVSCALITDRSNVYTGICLDLACGIGFCAEHSAIGFAAARQGNRRNAQGARDKHRLYRGSRFKRSYDTVWEV